MSLIKARIAYDNGEEGSQGLTIVEKWVDAYNPSEVALTYHDSPEAERWQAICVPLSRIYWWQLMENPYPDQTA